VVLSRYEADWLNDVNITVGNAIQDTVVRIFRDKLDVEVSSSETDLLETGIIDSLKFVDLVYNLEQEFEITMPMESLEVDQFRTIAEIVLLVSRLQIPVKAPSGGPS
jgi:acyl carrier protein